MKKALTVIFSALLTVLLASCSQPESNVTSPSEISIVPAESSVQKEELSEESPKESLNSESVSDTSKEMSEISDVSEISDISEISQISEEQSLQNSEETQESQIKDSYSKQLVEKVVDVEELGDKTKSAVTDVLEGDEVYMNVTGKIALFGGITSNFDVEIAKSDDGTMEKITFGNQSMKILQNSDGTYTIDDENKTATLTGSAYHHDDDTDNDTEVSETSESYTSNAVANQVISYLSSSFGLDSLKYEQSGSEEYQDKTYSFDEYSSDDTIIKVYFDGDKPEYIVSTDEQGRTSVIEIHSLTSAPDSDIFKIPENYSIIGE